MESQVAWVAPNVSDRNRPSQRERSAVPSSGVVVGIYGGASTRANGIPNRTRHPSKGVPMATSTHNPDNRNMVAVSAPDNRNMVAARNMVAVGLIALHQSLTILSR
jgi:hypothetical protein